MKRLLLLAFIWGWSFLFIKVSVEGMSPATVACARVGLGALVLIILLRVRHRSLPDLRNMWPRFLVAALFANVLPFTMLAWGEERITSAVTAVLNASTPLFTAIIAAVYLKDRLKPIQVVGLLLGFAGVSVAAGLGGGDLAHSSITGSIAAVLAGASYGVAFAYMRKHLTTVDPTIAATGQLLMATLLSLPLAIGTSISSGIHLDPHRVLAIVLLGVFGTGIAYILNYRVIAELGATRASLVTYVIPVVAVTVGVVVLDEPFEWRLVWGGLLIIAGIALVHPPTRLRRPRMQPVIGPAVLLVVVALVVAADAGLLVRHRLCCMRAGEEGTARLEPPARPARRVGAEVHDRSPDIRTPHSRQLRRRRARPTVVAPVTGRCTRGRSRADPVPRPRSERGAVADAARR